MVLLAGDVSPNPGWSDSRLLKPGLKIGHLNIRSLPRHIDELKILLQENPFDVLWLNETWLNSSWSDAELAIDDYNFIRNDRNDDRRLQFILNKNSLRIPGLIYTPMELNLLGLRSLSQIRVRS